VGGLHNVEGKYVCVSVGERRERERERERERGRRCLGEFTLTLQANINLGQDLASLM
jgi:hypothetical protein